MVEVENLPMDNVAIVVGANDAYASAWEPLIHGLKKYLPVSWPLFFITNRQNGPLGCQTIKVGGDLTNWGGRMRQGLKQIPVKTLLWLIDDHWPAADADIDAIMDFASLVRSGKIARLRLYPGLNHDYGKPYKRDKRLIILDRKSPYRCSCKPSFWNKKIFLSLLREHESPWDFERRGRERSKDYKFAVTKDWHFYFVTNGCPDGGNWAKSPIVKGRLTVAARHYYEREGLKFNLKHPIKKNPFGKDIPDWVLP